MVLKFKPTDVGDTKSDGCERNKTNINRAKMYQGLLTMSFC